MGYDFIPEAEISPLAPCAGCCLLANRAMSGNSFLKNPSLSHPFRDLCPAGETEKNYFVDNREQYKRTPGFPAGEM
jgi:hypothetical protein